MTNSGGKLIIEREHAIEWLITPKADRVPETQKELEVKLGVAEGIIAKWKRRPDFLDEVLIRAKNIARISHTPEIIEATAKEAKQGNQQATANYFKYIEQIAEITEININKKVSDILDDDTKEANRKPPVDSEQAKKGSKVKTE